MKRKILYVIDSLFYEGTEKHLLQVIKHLPKEKYEISIFSFSEGPLAERFRSNGASLYLFPETGHGPWGIKKLFSLLFFMRGKKFDIVHTFLVSSDIWGRMAAIVKCVPCIISSKRGFAEKNFRYTLVSKVLNLFTKRIVFVSNDLKQRYREVEGIHDRKCSVIPNGADTEEIFSFRDRFQNTNEKKNIIISMIARLHPVKDHPTFISAAAHVAKKFPHVEFWIVGSGQERDNLVSLTKSLGIGEKVKFLETREDVYEIMENSDIIVLTSVYEGMPNALLEAMAFGKPIVATSVGGIKEMVLDGVNGYLVPPRDPALLAEKLGLLIRDPELVKKFGEAAREIVSTKFTLEKMVRMYDSLYQDSCAGAT